MNETAIKDIVKREKLYKKNNSYKKTTIFLSILCLIYIFFWTSNITMSPPISKESSITAIGKEYDFAEKRTFRLVSAVYSKEQKMMEVVLDFTNDNHDNVNDYYYVIELLRGNADKVDIIEAYNEELFTVIRFSNLKKSYKELSLYFAPKIVSQEKITDEMTGTIILNKLNVAEGKINTTKTRTAYLKERFSSVIDDYENKLHRENEKLSDYQNNEVALKNEIESLTENMEYMTEREMAANEQIIAENKTDLKEIRNQIKMQEVKIEGIKEEISSANEKLKNLE